MMDLHKNGWQDFLKLCSNITSPDELRELFDLFFTFEEKETLASRYLIIKALVEKANPARNCRNLQNQYRPDHKGIKCTKNHFPKAERYFAARAAMNRNYPATAMKIPNEHKALVFRLKFS